MIRAKVPGKKADFKKIPAGIHLAVCNMVADIGMQETNFGEKHQILYRFEFPTNRLEWTKDDVAHEGPMVLTQTYTLSMHEDSNLRKMLESWRGRQFDAKDEEEFDFGSVLGACGMATIVHKGDWANVAFMSPLGNGQEAAKAEMDLLLFDNDNVGSLGDLPEWVQKKIGAQVHSELPPVPFAGDNPPPF